jgi:hypothetical protein
MGKLFNDKLKHTNFPFKRVILGPSFAEERRGNLEVRRQSEPSGDLSPIGRDEGEAEQDNPDPSRLDEDGSVGKRLSRKSSRQKKLRSSSSLR